MADSLSDIVQKIAFYEAGGQEENSLDKINKIFGTIGNTGTNLASMAKLRQDIVNKKLEAAKTQIESEKLAKENAPASTLMAPRVQQRLNEPITLPKPTSAYSSDAEIRGALDEARKTRTADASKMALDAEKKFGGATVGQYKDMATADASLAMAGLREKQAEQVGKDKSIYVNEIISKATGLPIGDIPVAQFNATLASVKLLSRQDPNRKLTPYQAVLLGVPFGTTASQAEGIIPRTQTDKNNINKFNGAFTLLDRLDVLTDNVLQGVEPGIMNRVIAGGENAVESWKQSNPNINLLDSTIGELTVLIKALGDTGNIAVQERALAAEKLMPKAVPTLFPPSLPDTYDVAKGKIDQVRNILKDAVNIYVQSLQTPLKPGVQVAGGVAQSGQTSDISTALQEANSAISQGADRNKVRARLLSTFPSQSQAIQQGLK